MIMASSSPKPKVMAISSPKWVGDDYMKEFESKFDLHIVTPGDRPTTMKNVADKIKSDGPFEAILILMGLGPYEPFDEEFLKPLLPELKIMGSASAGYNEFDVDWMTQNNIIFCNSRNAVCEATADLAIFFMLGILRDIRGRESSLINGTWRGKTNGQLLPTRDPSGLTLGLVGMGAIGKLVARKSKLFNMKIIYYKRTRLDPKEEAALEVTYCPTLDDLLSKSDVLSLHCPLNDNTTGMISHDQFAKMKDGVFLVNTCRGPVVDEEAFINAMKSGKVERAGLDVFDNEPNINPYFIKNDRVMIQPHMGGLTDVAWQRAYKEAMENIRSYFETGKAISPVNADKIQKGNL